MYPCAVLEAPLLRNCWQWIAAREKEDMLLWRYGCWQGTYAAVDGPTPMHIWPIVSELRELFLKNEEAMKLCIGRMGME